MKKYLKSIVVMIFMLGLVLSICACGNEESKPSAENNVPAQPNTPNLPTPDVTPEKPEDKPTEPTEPQQPVEPEKPTEPTEPTGPSTPTEPQQPAEPDTPTQPEEPSTPAEPETPSQPETPAEPDTPALPDWEVIPVLPPVPFDENDDDVTKVKSAISSDNDEALTALYEYLKNADADAFTLVDADNNGIPEVVIRKNITSSIVMFTVAGYADGKIVSDTFHDEKYFGDLKYNGWNTTSSGNASIVRYIPTEEKLKYNAVVAIEKVEGEYIYTVCGKTATNEQYNKVCDMFYALPDAIWLDKTDTNINAVFGTTAEYYGLEPWQVAYFDFLEKDLPGYEGSAVDYYLVFVDSDNIPELVRIGPTSSSGVICAYKNGQRVKVTCGSRYIPTSGLAYHSTGRMGYYYDTVYLLTDSGFITLFEGNEQISNFETLNSEGEVVTETITKYYISGQSVTEEEYNTAMHEVFNRSLSKMFSDSTHYERGTIKEAIKNWDYSILPTDPPVVPDEPAQPETPSTPSTPSDIVAPPKPETPEVPTSPSDIG